MRFTRRDGFATLFVVAAAVIYALWLTGAAFSDTSTRVIGAVVLGLGWAACTSNQAEMGVVYGAGTHRRVPMTYVVTASLVGLAALVAGLITLVSGNEAMLATLVAATITLWAMSTVRHALAGRNRRNDQAIREPLDRAA